MEDVCAGADAVIEEQMALMQDFKDEVRHGAKGMLLYLWR